MFSQISLNKTKQSLFLYLNFFALTSRVNSLCKIKQNTHLAYVKGEIFVNDK